MNVDVDVGKRSVEVDGRDEWNGWGVMDLAVVLVVVKMMGMFK